MSGRTQLNKEIGNQIRIVRSEFLEMPGLRLSKRQAARLWNLDPDSTDLVMSALIEANFLRRTPNDLYIKADDGSC
jgi:hypothetical protein